MPIDRLAPELDRLISVDQEIEVLGSGYGIAEGPIWFKEGGYLLFSDIRGSKRWKWSPSEGVTLFLEPTNGANGLTRDLQGRLIACEHESGRVRRYEPDGTETVIAYSYRGKRLNRPNDVVVKSDGSIYFTNPGAPDPDLELDYSGVYRVAPDLGSITLIAGDFVFPNGLAFSPDESILYIDDYRRGHIRAFDVQPNGTLALATSRIFIQTRDVLDQRADSPDGMKVDSEGNVYCTGPNGVWIIDPSGKHLGTIPTEDASTNVAWGGDDWKTLFITTRTIMGRVTVKVPGIPVPNS